MQVVDVLRTLGIATAVFLVIILLLAKSQRFRTVCIPLIVLLAGTVWYFYRKAVERVCHWLARRSGKRPPTAQTAPQNGKGASVSEKDGVTTAKTPRAVSAQKQTRVKVKWMKDEDAPNCLHCGVKFTLLLRRHQ